MPINIPLKMFYPKFVLKMLFSLLVLIQIYQRIEFLVVRSLFPAVHLRSGVSSRVVEFDNLVRINIALLKD